MTVPQRPDKCLGCLNPLKEKRMVTMMLSSTGVLYLIAFDLFTHKATEIVKVDFPKCSCYVMIVCYLSIAIKRGCF